MCQSMQRSETINITKPKSQNENESQKWFQNPHLKKITAFQKKKYFFENENAEINNTYQARRLAREALFGYILCVRQDKKNKWLQCEINFFNKISRLEALDVNPEIIISEAKQAYKDYEAGLRA